MCAVSGTMPAGAAAVLPAPGRGSHHWLRRALIVLGFLFGAWLISSLASQQDAHADAPPPARPVLPVLPVSVTVPAVPDLAAVITPVTAATSEVITHVVPRVVHTVQTTTQVITNRVTATAVGTVRQVGAALQPVRHLPRVLPVLQVPEVRHGAPTPRTSGHVPGEVHRAVTRTPSGAPAPTALVAGPAVTALGGSTAGGAASPAPVGGAAEIAVLADVFTHLPVPPAPAAPHAPAAPVVPPAPSAPVGGDHQSSGTGLAWIPAASPAARDALFVSVLEQRTTLHSARFGAPTVSPD